VTSEPRSAVAAARWRGWPPTRILFLLAGTFTLIGVLLAVTVSAWFLVIPAIVALNQLLMVTTGSCPASLLLSRLGIGTPTCT
jgi:hypothetical protein